MPSTAAELAHRLARDAEAVCRHYLPSGRREGRYWLAGDVENTPGRSLFVRLTGPDSGKGAAGKWTDAATGEHGDLLDLIAANRRLDTLGAVLEEVRSFLRLPRPEPRQHERQPPAPQGSLEAAKRLWAMSKPIAGTVAEKYLHGRGLTDLRNCGALRFHTRCYYRGNDAAPGDSGCDAWPALIASVRDGEGHLTGISRTWLALDGRDKASVATPRRAMGKLLGHGIRFGVADDVLAAGEGTETMLSLRQVTPTLPMVAATSANHLAALELPASLSRLYLVRDNDPAGYAATGTLSDRAAEAGIDVLILDAVLGDLNDDLRRLGRYELAARVRVQLAPEDVARFIVTPDGPHRDAITLGNRETPIHELTLLEVPGMDGGLAAVAWFAHHDYKGAIPSSALVKGVRVRVGNIQIGDHAILEQIFPESRFNSWTVGEVHVLDRRIVPNGRRDEFEANAHYANLVNQLSPVGRDVARRCRTSSNLRSKLRDFEFAVGDAQERIAVIGQGAMSAGAHAAEIGRVHQSVLRMRKAMEAEGVEPLVRDDMSSRIAAVEAELDRVSEGALSDPLDVVAEGERDTYRQVFNLIYECSANRSAAKSLVDKIIQRLAA